ncbi:hypothetical protein [Alteromonas gilva]|uniref:Uncharacterized protein n=1 Tax=Alteromonas gilva TaxID=2987522 RepID=A0ABT5L5P9_9ALTE|nr:hypothetical protein [Alteromonas gilva]MDC8832383.1 hypothetical protein [Alteromonas gilva]
MIRRLSCLFFIYSVFVSGLVAGQSEVVVSFAGQQLTAQDIQPDEPTRQAWQDDPMRAARLNIYRFSKASEFIERQLIKDYAVRHDLSANPAFVESFKAAFASDTLTGERLASLAEFSALQFAVDKHLYERHGGRVIFDQAHPMMPIEGYFNVVQQYVAAEQLVINDETIAKMLWQSFARPNAITMQPDQIDYTAPWWNKITR